MADCYTYDMLTKKDGTECYALRRNTKILGDHCFCIIEVRAARSYVLTTQWGSKHVRRIEWFNDLDLAMRAGTDWAIRRAKEDAS